MAVIDWKEAGVDRINEIAQRIQEANGDRIALNAMGMFDMPPAMIRPALDHVKLGERFKFERAQMQEAIKRENMRVRTVPVMPKGVWDIAQIEREAMMPRRYPGDDEMAGPRMLRQHIGPEATIDRVISQDMHRSDAKDAIERRHGRYLSGGQATTAYRIEVLVKDRRLDYFAHDPSKAFDSPAHSAVERCYRVSSRDEAARRVIDLAIEHQDDPYAPKVYAVLDLPFGAWVSEMELLDRAHTPGKRTDADRRLYGWQLGEDWQYSTPGKVRPSRLLLEKSPFMRAVDKLRVRIGADYDLHGANVMKRGEQIVVLDPLYKC